jgi:UDP-N-acetylglucosamine 2-epimerase (non-hydrolysing)
MPEEINRLVTDRLANLLLTPSRDASDTLRQEGEPEEEIEFVGNVMIDTLLHSLPAARATGFRDRMGAGDDTIVVTLHRPSNVDDSARLTRIAHALRQLAENQTVIFPFTRAPNSGFGTPAPISVASGCWTRSAISRCSTSCRCVRGRHRLGGLQEETTALAYRV